MEVNWTFIIGKHQTRALSESLLSPNDSLREIAHELSSGSAAELTSYFSSLGPSKTFFRFTL